MTRVSESSWMRSAALLGVLPVLLGVLPDVLLGPTKAFAKLALGTETGRQRQGRC